MDREAQLLAAMPYANLAEQRQIMAELNTIRAAARRASEDTIAQSMAAGHLAHLQPRHSALASTAAADWLGDVVVEHTAAGIHQAAKTDATEWFRGVHALVRNDPDEMRLQAAGVAEVFAGAYSPHEDVYGSSFMQQAAHLSGFKVAWFGHDKDKDDKSTEPTQEPFDTFMHDNDWDKDAIDLFTGPHTEKVYAGRKEDREKRHEDRKENREKFREWEREGMDEEDGVARVGPKTAYTFDKVRATNDRGWIVEVRDGSSVLDRFKVFDSDGVSVDDMISRWDPATAAPEGMGDKIDRLYGEGSQKTAEDDPGADESYIDHGDMHPDGHKQTGEPKKHWWNVDWASMGAGGGPESTVGGWSASKRKTAGLSEADLTIVWDYDPEGDYSYLDQPEFQDENKDDHEMYTCVVTGPGDVVLGALGSIDFLASEGGAVTGSFTAEQARALPGYQGEVSGQLLAGALETAGSDDDDDDLSTTSTRKTADTCSDCGDAIASNDGDDGYHHDNGEVHDHEAMPGGDDDSDDETKTARKTSANWPDGRWVDSDSVTEQDLFSVKGPDGDTKDGKVWVSYDEMPDKSANLKTAFGVGDLVINGATSGDFAGMKAAVIDGPSYGLPKPQAGKTWVRTVGFGYKQQWDTDKLQPATAGLKTAAGRFRIQESVGRSGNTIYTLQHMGDAESPGYGMWEDVKSFRTRTEAEAWASAPDDWFGDRGATMAMKAGSKVSNRQGVKATVINGDAFGLPRVAGRVWVLATVKQADDVHGVDPDDPNSSLPVVTVEHSDKDTENLGWVGSGPATDPVGPDHLSSWKVSDIVHSVDPDDPNSSLPVVTPENEDDATEDFGWTQDQAAPDLGSDRLLQTDLATTSAWSHTDWNTDGEPEKFAKDWEDSWKAKDPKDDDKTASSKTASRWTAHAVLSNASYTDDDTDLFG